MGCWNGTCMVSGLPITWGDEIVMFVIKQNVGSQWGHECYSYAEASLVSPPIFGKYNDYGGIEEIDYTDELKKTFKWLTKTIVPSPGCHFGVDTDNQYHCFIDGCEDLESLIIQNIERGSASIISSVSVSHLKDGKVSYSTCKEKASLALAMIKREIWDELIMSHEDSGIKSEIEQLRSDYKKFESDSEDKPLWLPTLKLESMYGYWNGMHPCNLTNETEYVMFKFLRYLERLRLHIRPYTGLGSQTEEYDEHKKLAEFSIKLLEKKQVERDEW